MSVDVSGAEGSDRASPEEVREIEAYFLRNGLPHLSDGYNPREDTLTRLRPALVVLFIIGLVFVLRPDWPWWQRIPAVLAGIGVAGAAIGVVNVARGRRFWSAPERVGFVEAAALVLAAPAAALALGEDNVDVVYLAIGAALAAVALYSLASFGVLSLLVHHARSSVAEVRMAGAGALRAMPPLLAVLLFLSLSSETWQAFGLLEGWRFGGVIVAFALLIAAILLVGLGAERRELYQPADTLRLRDRATTTPAEPLVERGVEPSPRRLTAVERLNVTLSLMITLGVRVVVVGAAVGLFFLIFGVLVVDEMLIQRWTGVPPHVYLEVSISGREVVLTEELVRVATLLGSFAAVYFAAVSLVERRNREEFVDDEVERLSRVMAAWSYYRGALHSR